MNRKLIGEFKKNKHRTIREQEGKCDKEKIVKETIDKSFPELRFTAIKCQRPNGSQ